MEIFMQAKFIEYKKDINQYYSNNKIFNSKDYNMFTKIKDCNYLSRVLGKLIKNWKTAFSFFKKNMSEILNNGNEVFAEYCLKIILNAKREYIDKVTRLLKKAKIEPNFIAKIFRGAYDNSFAYRLCYNLRNYVQHVDIVGIYLLKDYDGKISFKIDLSKYRDNHDGIQPSFKKELEVIESDTYDLNSLLDDLNEQILQIHTKIVDGDKVKITVAPKGFGSENMSKLKMFTPAATREDIVEYILDCLVKAGGNPCPPIVLGIGIGGDFEQCAYLAKKALCRDVSIRNSNEYYSDMEKEILSLVNCLNIGPQGFGGKTTALAVNIETAPTHIAGLPVAVNFGCHVTRHKSTTI